jgi:hypothetical protein
MRDTIDFYESLTVHALRETFKQPLLLFVAMLVATVNTGSVLFHLYQFATILAPLDRVDFSITSALPPIAWLAISNTRHSGLGALAVTVLGSVVLFFAGVTAQQYLINAAHGRGTTLARHKSNSIFTFQKPWMHLLYTNAIYFIGLIVLFLVGGTILTNLPEANTLLFSLGSAMTYALLILAAFCWNVIILLSLMHIVREGSSVHEALQASFTHVAKHPLSIFELSCLQLLAELVFTLVSVAIIGAANVLAALLLTLLSASGNAFLLQSGFLFMGFTIALGVLLLAGIITSFGYHLWSQYHKMSHSITIKPVLLHLATELKTLFSRT